ncbi:MAG: hypothetical protein K2K72_04380, partial [Duncaniella sp.]|nr:hypothetical protein [Duncaniella sp.]
LSMASVDNEYQAAGGGFTHLWKSDKQLLFYDRFTPFIYQLNDGDAEKYINLDENDIPDEVLVNELITLPVPQRFTKMAEHTELIIDISACYETDKYIVMEMRTSPIKFIAIDKKTGEYFKLSTLLTDRVKSSIGLIGTYGEYFVTASSGEEAQNPVIVLLDITEK